jgi:hypothetical protein
MSGGSLTTRRQAPWPGPGSMTSSAFVCTTRFATVIASVDTMELRTAYMATWLVLSAVGSPVPISETA